LLKKPGSSFLQHAFFLPYRIWKKEAIALKDFVSNKISKTNLKMMCAKKVTRIPIPDSTPYFKNRISLEKNKKIPYKI
jgi:hypothetical protein